LTYSAENRAGVEEDTVIRLSHTPKIDALRCAAFLSVLASLCLTGCANLLAHVPDAQARAEMRAEMRREQLLEESRARREALEERAGRERLSLAEHLRKGDQFRDSGDISKAYLSYLRGHWAERENLAPLRRLAFLALRGDPADSERIFTDLIEDTPDDASLFLGLAGARLARGDLDGAQAALLDALALDPALAVAEATLGVVADRLKRYREAQDHYRAALLLRPDDARILNNLGVSYLLSGDYELAAETLAEAVDLDAGDAALHNNLGLALGLAGRYADALGVFREAGSQGDAYNNIGYVLFLKGSYDLAAWYYEKALLSNDTDEERVIANLSLLESVRGEGAAEDPL
jgi:Flp pilus assembly protein TadD